MRALSFVSAPLAMTAMVFGAGWWLRSMDMLHARLQYDAMGGPAAYVLYGIVVLLGMTHLLLDRVVDAARIIRSRRAGRYTSLSRPPSRHVLTGPAPARPPASAPARPAAPTPRVVRAVRRPRAPRIVAPAAAMPVQR